MPLYLKKKEPWNKDHFAKRLMHRYPGKTPKQALQDLMDRYGTLRAIHRATGLPLVSLSRWGGKLNVYNPNYPTRGWRYADISRLVYAAAPKGKKGRNLRQKVLRLKEEEGSWNNVARLLGVDVVRLRNYRKYIGLKLEKKDTLGTDSSVDSRWDQHTHYYGVFE